VIERVVSVEQWEVADAVIRAYVAALGFDLCFQDVGRELAELSTEYGPPHGAAFLADDVGFVGIRRFDDDVAELKRMYVQPAARGRGLGRALAEAAVGEARRLGYRRVRLDTLASMEEAVALYRALGFVDIAPYRDNPIPGARYLELSLD
jgi:putative acetyltransferase